MRTVLSIALALGFAPLAAAAPATLIRAARIHTVDLAVPQAEAMAVGEDGRILALGTAAALAKQYPDAKRIDYGARTIVPGLIDAHGHVLGLGLALLQADLVGTRSKDEAVARLQAHAKTLPKGEWLLGRGWDQNDWPEKVFPTAADLDQAFPDRPVWLRRVDGHAAWANSAAMKLAARDLSGDWQPGGGRIERRDGKATGVFVDGAMNLIDATVPATSPALAEQALSKAMHESARWGLTGVHDMGVSRTTMALFRKLADAGGLPIRIYALADGDNDALDDLCEHGAYRHAGGRLEMRAVKLYADGALGSRGAALIADYSDDPGNRGLLVTESAALDRAVAKAKRCKLQIATHAIGDRGNRAVLDSYARALGSDAGVENRWRIEHAQVVAPADIPRFANLHVIASMQPTHATSDMPWAEARVGAARIVGAYAWRRFRDTGARLAFGSDFPVEAVNPALGLYAAVSRQDGEGKPEGGWYPDQRVTAFEALRGFTLDAAYAGFAENDFGSLTPGKRADFTVLDRDPIAVSPHDLLQTTVIATYVDGKPVYESNPAR